MGLLNEKENDHMKSVGMGTGMGNCKPHGSMGEVPAGKGGTGRVVDHTSMGDMGAPPAKAPDPGGVNKAANKGRK
jgi:hypothetical protein